MQKLNRDQNGLIPLILFMLALVIGMIVLVYLRVRGAQ